MKQRELELSGIEREALENYRDHDRRPQARERCAALLKIAEGESAHAVARHGLLRPRDPDTVYGWMNLYKAEGIDGLLGKLHGGNHRPFPDEHDSGH